MSEIRDRIVRFLSESGRPMAADEILREALNIHAPSPAAAEKVLRAVAGSDDRFVRKGRLWLLSLAGGTLESAGIPSPASLHLEQARPNAGRLVIRGALYSPVTRSTWEFDWTSLPDVRRLRGWFRDSAPGCLAVWSGHELRLWKNLLLNWGFDSPPAECLNLHRFASRVLGDLKPGAKPEDLAAMLDLPPPDLELTASMARYLLSCLQALLDRTPEENRRSLDALGRWIDEGHKPVDFSGYGFSREYIRQLPERPGIYVMRNRAGDILYVGKSRNLRRRVGSYFTSKARRIGKIARIQDQIHTLEIIATPNEVEALMLEMRMIRDFRPPINAQFDVHEQAASYGRNLNLLLLVRGEEGALGYFFREGFFAGRQPLTLGQHAPARLLKRIKTTFFSRRSRKSPPGDPWEQEILVRWLAANRKWLNFIDVDSAGSYENTLRLLDAYLHDPDRLAHKVLYR